MKYHSIRDRVQHLEGRPCPNCRIRPTYRGANLCEVCYRKKKMFGNPNGHLINRKQFQRHEARMRWLLKDNMDHGSYQVMAKVHEDLKNGNFKLGVRHEFNDIVPFMKYNDDFTALEWATRLASLEYADLIDSRASRYGLMPEPASRHYHYGLFTLKMVGFKADTDGSHSKKTRRRKTLGGIIDRKVGTFFRSAARHLLKQDMAVLKCKQYMQEGLDIEKGTRRQVTTLVRRLKREGVLTDSGRAA